MSAPLDRRSFLTALPGAAVVLRAAPVWGATAPTSAVTDLGVQVYTVRSLMQQGPGPVLAELAAIGYREVELAGLYGMTPRAMRAELDAFGLRAASSHHGLTDVRGGWSGVLDGAQVLGQKLVVVPSIPEAERTSEGLRRVADDFNRAGEAARAVGLRFGYHNHGWEFQALPDGGLPMTLLLERCEPGLVDWQMDVFWAVDGGEDPLSWLDAHAGRVTSMHVKDRSADGQMVDVGAGILDYQTVLARAQALGLEHVFVEHDWPADPMQSVRRSFEHLRGLLPPSNPRPAGSAPGGRS